MYKIAIITNIIPPYRVPLFNYLASRPDIDLRVILCAKTEPGRHWKWPKDIQFDYEIDNSYRIPSPFGKPTYLGIGIIKRLKKYSPDVIIVGSLGLVGLLAWLASRLQNSKFILWSEATVHSEERRNKFLLPLRRFLVNQSHSFIAASSSAVEYFLSLRADSNKIFISLQTLDILSFRSEVNKWQNKIPEIKKRMGIEGSIILYVGNLDEYKGPDLLLSTFIEATKTLPGIRLMLIGTGNLLQELQKKANAAAKGKVHFSGFVQHHKLPMYYAIADLFCLFSRSETFGVVVTEAITAGLPVLCSKYAGAANDLVKNDENGFIVDPYNVAFNSKLMNEICSNKNIRLSMGNHSHQKANKCTIEEAGTGFQHAINAAFENNKQ